MYLGPCQKSILELITSELSLEVPLLQNINEKYDLSGFCGCNQFLWDTKKVFFVDKYDILFNALTNIWKQPKKHLRSEKNAKQQVS